MQKVRYNKYVLADNIIHKILGSFNAIKVLFHLSLAVLVYYRSLRILGSKEDLLY